MKKGAIELKNLLMGVFVLIISTVLLSAGDNASAQKIHFSLQGNGSFMDSPPRWSGDIIGGELSGGTFWMEFDDSNWPEDDPGTTENERWDYIFSTYFIYDNTAGAECWDGTLPDKSIGDNDAFWRFYTTAGDTIGGTVSSFRILIGDNNANGIMEDIEYEMKSISGILVAWINFSAGCYESLCGWGSFSGELNMVDDLTWEETLYVPSATDPIGHLSLSDSGCNTDSEKSSWGAVKSIYRD